MSRLRGLLHSVRRAHKDFSNLKCSLLSIQKLIILFTCQNPIGEALPTGRGAVGPVQTGRTAENHGLFIYSLWVGGIMQLCRSFQFEVFSFQTIMKTTDYTDDMDENVEDF